MRAGPRSRPRSSRNYWFRDVDGSQVYPVPAYMPAVTLAVIPWARQHVARVSARYRISRDDLWDEALTALLRAACHWQADVGTFGPYARTAIHRAMWRHGVRSHLTRPELAEYSDELGITSASAEDEYEARELVALRLAQEPPPAAAKRKATAS